AAGGRCIGAAPGRRPRYGRLAGARICLPPRRAGEVVRADAIRAAIPDYMRFPALREMHQLSAAGTTLEAEVCEDGTTRIVAHVVDPVAVAKVKNQVYRGFSIGGRVTQRDAANPKGITPPFLTPTSPFDPP